MYRRVQRSNSERFGYGTGFAAERKNKKTFEFYWQYTFNNGCALVYIDTEERQLKILNGEKGHEYNVGV